MQIVIIMNNDTEVRIKTYDDGSRRAIYNVKNDGAKHGEYKHWDREGQLKIHCFYKDGKREGECKHWHMGQIVELCYYKNDKIDGEYKLWWHSGHLREHFCAKDGLYHGFRINYFDNYKFGGLYRKENHSYEIYEHGVLVCILRTEYEFKQKQRRERQILYERLQGELSPEPKTRYGFIKPYGIWIYDDLNKYKWLS